MEVNVLVATFPSTGTTIIKFVNIAQQVNIIIQDKKDVWYALKDINTVQAVSIVNMSEVLQTLRKMKLSPQSVPNKHHFMMVKNVLNVLCLIIG